MTADYDDVLMLAVATTIMNDCRNKSGEERLAAIVRHLAFVIEQERAKLAKAREALRPLAAHAGILEMGFSAEELAAMDHEHHLIAHGITIGDSFRARSVLKEIDDAKT